MGFVRHKTYLLRFVGDQWHGLEVRARPVSLRVYQRVVDLTDGGLHPADTGRRDEFNELLGHLADSIDTWNVEDVVDGVAVPVAPDVDGLTSRDQEMVVALASAWVDALAGVDDPLSGPSANGAPTAPVLPMEPLSASLAS